MIKKMPESMRRSSLELRAGKYDEPPKGRKSQRVNRFRGICNEISANAKSCDFTCAACDLRKAQVVTH